MGETVWPAKKAELTHYRQKRNSSSVFRKLKKPQVNGREGESGGRDH